MKSIGILKRKYQRCQSLSTLFLMVAIGSQAQSILVTTSLDVVNGADGLLSLREAIQLANNTAGLDTISFDNSLNGDTILLTLTGSNENNNATGDLDITDADGLVIMGNGTFNTIIDGNNSDRIFHHQQGSLTILNVCLQNGMASNLGLGAKGGGLLTQGDGTSSLTIKKCLIQNCISSGDGGGAFAISNSSATPFVVNLDSVKLSDNEAPSGFIGSGGGAMLVSAAELLMSISNTTAAGNNSAQEGGALYADVSSGFISISNSHFDNNQAGSGISSQAGGAICLTGSIDSFEIENSNFTYNEVINSGGDGGALFLNLTGSKSLISHTSFLGNAAMDQGGALGVTGNGQQLEVVHCNFMSDSANIGGAIAVLGSNHLTQIIQCQLDSNFATNGGGLHLAGSGQTTIVDGCSFVDNQATTDGGALRSDALNAEINLINSTISGNRAGRYGGGLAFNNEENVSLQFVTIAYNQSNVGNNMFGNGGGLALTNATSASNVTVFGCIIQENVAQGVSSDEDCFNNSGTGNLLSQGGNVFGLGTGCPVGSIDTTGDAGLETLALNGGFTRTHAITLGSTALNFSACGSVMEDQREFLRSDGFCDAGAFEAIDIIVPSQIQVSTSADSTDGNTTSIWHLLINPGVDGLISLREAITAANHTPGMDTIFFASTINGDTIKLKFGLADENQNLNGDLDISDTSGICIIGNGIQNTMISGQDTVGLIDCNEGNLYLQHLTLQNGNQEYTDTRSGAGIHMNGRDLFIYDCLLKNNQAEFGAGIYNPANGSRTFLCRTTLQENEAYNGTGGGIYINGTDGIVFIDSCTFFGNIGSSGGAFDFNASNGTLTIQNSIISHNQATNHGGGIYLSNSGNGTSVIHNCLIDSNFAIQNGGGIYLRMSGSPLEIINTTISGNSCEGSGGGINHNANDSPIHLNFVTITNNIADSDLDNIGDGGGIDILEDFDTATLTIQNSIVHGNLDLSTVTLNDCSNSGGIGVYTSLGGNVFGKNTGCPVTSLDTTGNALLDLLMDNGGFTSTHGLLPGSAAINFAQCDAITSDQRGYVRIDGNCDAGAYEYLPQSPHFLLVTTANDTVDGQTGSIDSLIMAPGNDGKISLREAISAANNTPGLDTIYFAEIINGDTIKLNLGQVEENLNGNGDLDILDTTGLCILGNGIENTIVSGQDTVGILACLEGDLHLHHLTLQNGNQTAENGFPGAGVYMDGQDLFVYDCLVKNNRAGFGAGIYNQVFEGHTFLYRTTLQDNKTYDGIGGGVFLSGVGGVALIDSCILSGNFGSFGGGLNFGAPDGILTLKNSIISNNHSTYNGGGIYLANSDDGNALINHCLIDSNFASQDGGGIYLSMLGSPLTIINTTISGNSSQDSGGGICHAAGNSPINLNFVTITNNIADADTNDIGDGGGIDISEKFISPTLSIHNSIVQGNTDQSTANLNDCSISGGIGVYSSLGGNVFGENTGCPVTSLDTTGNALLGSLMDNGGFSSTHALLPGSAAIDFADCDTITTDQRELERIYGNCDAGAYEAVNTSNRSWVGVINEDWQELDNWGEKLVPELGNKVTIADAPNDPVILPGVSAFCGFLTIEASGFLTVNNQGSLQIKDNASTLLEALSQGQIQIDLGGLLSIDPE